MSRVLYISAHAPSNLLQGGHKQAFMFLERYLASHELVDIVVITNTEEIAAATDLTKLAQQHGANLYTFPLSKRQKLLNCLNSPNLPLKFGTRFQRKTKSFIHQLLRSQSYDIIHFECIHAAVYLDSIKQHIDRHKTKIVTSIHDVFLQLLLRRLEREFLFNSLEAARTYLSEKAIFAQSDEVWVITSKDEKILTSLFSVDPAKVVTYTPKISDFVEQVKRSPDRIERGSLLYWGSMSRPENEQAILTFVENCFDQLQQTRSDVKLYIVGANPSKKVLSLASDRVIVTGFVEDPIEFFEKAQVGIIPLIEGAGIKLKALEMLQAGLPVLSTSVGAEGIEHDNLLVSDDFNEWLRLLSTLLDSQEEQERSVSSLTKAGVSR